MKLTRTFKIFCLVLAFAVCSAGAALSFGGAPAAFAADQTTTNFFSFQESEGTETSSAVLTGSALRLDVHDGTEASFIRELVMDDFSMTFTAGSFRSLSFVFSSDSPLLTSDEKVENVLKLTADGGKLYAAVNPVEDEKGTEIGTFAADSTEINIKISDLAVSVNEKSVGDFDAVRKYDRRLADLSVTVEADADLSVTVSEINTQTFAMDDEGNYTNVVKQTVLLRDDFFNEVDGENIKIFGYKNRISYTFYSVLPTSAYNTSTSDLSVRPAEGQEDKMEYIAETSSRYLVFNEVGSYSFDVIMEGDEGEDPVVYGTYSVTVIKDSEKPAYQTDNAEAIEKFRQDLEDAVWEDKEAGEYIQLGSSEYLSLPSMEDFVNGNGCSYGALSYTIEWKSDKTTGTSTTWRIPIASAGDYSFYVKFYKSYNEKLTMEDEDFEEGGIYEDMVFRFNIQDNHKPVDISAPSTQETAYVGVSYTARSFTFTGVDYSTSYKLFYSRNNIGTDADGWTEIKASGDLDEDDENYETMAEINYNGSLNFTPHALGYYKIEVTAVKDLDGLTSTSSTLIEVKERNKTVTPPSDWLENNVWTVVFLSIGTLCLIGIIVLLCVKPKEEPAAETKNKKK